MNILVVFFSMGGRTQIIAQNIADVLRNAKVDIERLKYNGRVLDYIKNEQNIRKGDISRFTFNRKILDLSQYDRIFFGAPVYGSRPPAVFNAFLENCKNTIGKEWVLFATCRMIGGKTLYNMSEDIKKKGGKVVNQHLFRHPVNINIKEAQAFGQSLINDRINSG